MDKLGLTSLCYGVHDPGGPQLIMVQSGKVYRHNLTDGQLYNLLEFVSHAIAKRGHLDVRGAGNDNDGKKCCGNLANAGRQTRSADYSVEYGRGPVIVWDR